MSVTFNSSSRIRPTSSRSTLEWDYKQQRPKKPSGKQNRVLEEIESRVSKTRRDIQNLKITKQDLSKKIQQVETEISELKHKICSVPNQVSGGTYQSKENKARFKRLLSTAKKKLRTCREWRDTATGNLRKTKQEINDLRMNKTVHLTSFKTSEEEMKRRELIVQEMEKELECLEEQRNKYDEETRQVAEAYENTSSDIQDECDDLDEKIDSLAVQISFVNENDEDVEEKEDIKLIDASSSSFMSFLKLASASCSDAESFVDEINRSKCHDEMLKEVHSFLKDELEIMKKTTTTNESLTSRTREIENRVLKTKQRLNQFQGSMKLLYNILQEHEVLNEIDSSSSSSSIDKEKHRINSSIVRAVSVLSQYWAVVS